MTRASFGVRLAPHRRSRAGTPGIVSGHGGAFPREETRASPPVPGHPPPSIDAVRAVRSMAWRWTRAVLALVAIALVLVGVPVALGAAAGWPFPSAVPDLAAFRDALGAEAVDDATVLKVLAVPCWLAWSQLALALVGEAVAVARGRPRSAVPVLPAARRLAVRLLASALMVTAVPVRPALAADLPAATVRDLFPGAETAGPGNGEGSEPSPQWGYRVRVGDSYWAIAERVLGDGERWEEIRHLNIGRAMGDGHVVDATDDVIEPGWLLWVPEPPDPTLPGLVALEAEPAGTDESGPALTPTEAVVQPGDHLWSLARARLEESARAPDATELDTYWREVVAANRDRLGDPDLVHPGDTIILPAPGSEGAGATGPQDATGGTRPVPAPPPTVGATPPETRSAPEPKVSPRAPGPVDSVASDEPDSGAERSVPVRALLGVAGAALAVGIARALRGARVRRARRMTTDAPPPALDQSHDDLRREVALGADHDQVGAMAEALDRVARHLAQGLSPARPRVLQVGPQGVEVFLSRRSVPAPPGWDSEASGALWQRATSPGGEPPAARVPRDASIGALVSLGREGTGQLSLDLEAEGVVALRGDPVAAQDLARAWVMELSQSPLAERAGIVVVGDLGGALGTLERVRVVQDWEAVASDVGNWADQSVRRLRAAGHPNALVARTTTPEDDALDPLVVICATLPEAESFQRLVEAVAEGTTAVSVLVVGDHVPLATEVVVDGDVVEVPSLGLQCRAQAVSEEAPGRLAELLTEAEEVPDPEPEDPPRHLRPVPVPVEGEDDEAVIPHEVVPVPDGDDVAPSPAAVPEQRSVTTGPTPRPSVPEETIDVGDKPDEAASEDEVIVRVLGEIRVEGTDRELTPQQSAVFAYIALHDPVGADRVEDAVWTEPLDTRRRRLVKTVSACRAAVGPEYLPAAEDGRYRTGEGVTTDLARFEDYVGRAATERERGSPVQALEWQRRALELVTGPVFSYRSADRASYVWVDLENWVSTCEYRVATAALEMVETCLEVGDLDGAVWASERGLLAVPAHTGLTEALMRVHARKGDRSMVECVFARHAQVLDELGIDDVAASTLEVLERSRVALQFACPSRAGSP